MTTYNDIKMRSVAETPLLLFECELSSGLIERWSTHSITVGTDLYEGRVLKHDLFEIRAASDGGIDAAARISVTLANADSYVSQIARTPGFKGAKLTARFVFVDSAGQFACSPVTVFRGVGNQPDDVTEAYARVAFTNRMSLQRILLPEIRIQRRCPWLFPSNAAQRSEAGDGGAKGLYSPFYRCGYSADVPGGTGNLNGSAAFESCDYTRTQCIERGMFDKDSRQQTTRRFGGVEFVPSSILVKSYGEKGTHLSVGNDNEAKYNDFVPLIYGTAWYRPPVVFARNDGNLTRMEVLLGMGEIEGITKIIVNGFELPAGSSAENPTATGWFNLVSAGSRDGAFNLDFAANSGVPAGDPYGSMAVASVVVPNRIADGSSVPRIEVLVQGMKLAAYGADASYLGQVFSNNPAWVLLDLLLRSGWNIDELEIPSFAATADYCAELIDTVDLNGNTKQVSRFQCNLVVSHRRSAADLIRGVRNSAALCLTYGSSGQLRLSPESSLAIQQPSKADGSNSAVDLNGGWPAYEFGDGGNGFTDILRRDSGEPSLRLWSRSTAESPNRYTVEFQDEFNEYQQDSLSLLDLEDTVTTGQEVSASLTALGIPNFNQAGRILRLFLDRSIRGNLYVRFETGLRGIGLKPGDLITLTYAKEGLTRQPFRIISIAPGTNYQSTLISAQIHDDSWYVGGGGQTSLLGGGRQPTYEVGVPRPLLGTALAEDGSTQFEIEETPGPDGAVTLAVKYVSPAAPSVSAPAVPFISLSAQIDTTGGTLPGTRSIYYAVSAAGEDGGESSLSFTVRADLPSASDSNQVTLRELSFAPGTSAFHVYRGSSPAQLYRIAENLSVASTYTDVGAAPLAISPPDRNYDHANFYWRPELLPAYPAGIHGTNSIGNSALGMAVNEYQGKTVRVMEGKGAGQERNITGNDATTMTITPSWTVEPDSSSKFAVCESAWIFAALSLASPATFSLAARTSSTIHISGRAANVHDKECAYDLSPLTRYTIGVAGDADVPEAPGFGLFASGRGTVEINGISFAQLDNTHTVQAGSCMLHYWDELAGAPTVALASDIDDEAVDLTFQAPVSFAAGALLQADSEIMMVQSSSGDAVTVERAAFGSSAAGHLAAAPVFPLERKAFILPFARGFFGSPASGSYSHTIMLPDVRVAAAELFVTNSIGNSQVTAASYTNTVDNGIRTLSGGQFSLQVDGPVAIESNAVPILSVEAAHAIRDIFASVRTAPSGGNLIVRLTRDNTEICQLTIPEDETVSNTVDGGLLPPLEAGWKLGLDVLSNGGPGAQSPTDLTVTIRL